MDGILTGDEIMGTDWQSFTDWLLTQQDRSDPVGHLAYDVADDEEWPADTDSLEELERYLKDQGAIKPALEALRQAWEEWFLLAPKSDASR